MKPLVIALLAAAFAQAALAGAPPRSASEHLLLGPYDFDESGKPLPRYYLLDEKPYSSIDALKTAVTNLPPGSKLFLRGSCEPDNAIELGPRPYMSLGSFRRFCRRHQVSFDWRFGR